MIVECGCQVQSAHLKLKVDSFPPAGRFSSGSRLMNWRIKTECYLGLHWCTGVGLGCQYFLRRCCPYCHRTTCRAVTTLVYLGAERNGWGEAGFVRVSLYKWGGCGLDQRNWRLGAAFSLWLIMWLVQRLNLRSQVLLRFQGSVVPAKPRKQGHEHTCYQPLTPLQGS